VTIKLNGLKELFRHLILGLFKMTYLSFMHLIVKDPIPFIYYNKMVKNEIL